MTCARCDATLIGHLVIGMGETDTGQPVCSHHATLTESRRRLTRLLSQGGRDNPLQSNTR